MSEAASAALADFAAAPAAPAPTAGDGTPPAAAAAPAAPAAPATPPAGAGDAKWWGTFGDETVRGFAETKNWKSPEDAIRSYQNLEKIVGSKANAVMVPGEDATAEDWAAFYDKAGRPGSPENYAMPEPLKDDPAMKAFAPVAHELGLTSKQWDGISKFITSQGEASAASEQAARTARAESDVAELKAENPGLKFDALKEQFRRGKADLGIDQATEARLEMALGTKGMITLMAKVGALQGETPFIEGDGRQPGVMSPEAARLEKAALEKDANWMKAWAAGDAEKVAKMNKLHKAAAGGKAE